MPPFRQYRAIGNEVLRARSMSKSNLNYKPPTRFPKLPLVLHSLALTSQEQVPARGRGSHALHVPGGHGDPHAVHLHGLGP